MFGRKKKEQQTVVVTKPVAQIDYEPGEEYVYQRASKPKKVKTIYAKVGGLTPVAKPSEFVQLTPIVTPISIVPYLTQEQPLMTYASDYEVYDEEMDED